MGRLVVGQAPVGFEREKSKRQLLHISPFTEKNVPLPVLPAVNVVGPLAERARHLLRLRHLGGHVAADAVPHKIGVVIVAQVRAERGNVQAETKLELVQQSIVSNNAPRVVPIGC